MPYTKDAGKRIPLINRARILCGALIFSFIAARAYLAPALEAERPEERITQPQPLYVGSLLYTKTYPKVGHQQYYTYLGFDGSYLKLKYELYYHFDELEESEILTLPIGGEAQAMFTTKPMGNETAQKATKLLISVIDSYGRVTVQRITQ